MPSRFFFSNSGPPTIWRIDSILSSEIWSNCSLEKWLTVALNYLVKSPRKNYLVYMMENKVNHMKFRVPAFQMFHFDHTEKDRLWFVESKNKKYYRQFFWRNHPNLFNYLWLKSKSSHWLGKEKKKKLIECQFNSFNLRISQKL